MSMSLAKVRSMKKRLVLALSLLLTMSAGVSGCGSSTSIASVNMVCAGVESYQSTKTFALMDAAEGESAQDSIDVTLGTQREAIGEENSVLSIFDEYLSAMRKWAMAVDQYQLEKQTENLSTASEELENQIDVLASQCEAKGWNFEDGWRS